MARKRREYQRRKVRENRIKDILCLLLFLFISLFFIYGLIESAVTIHQINNDSLNDYTGSYSYRLRKSFGRRGYRRDMYIITLDNGDVVTIRKQLCENEEILDEYRELTVMYPTIHHNPFSGRYSAVSITTSDGQVVVREAEASYRGRVGAVWIISVLLLLWLPLLGFLLVLEYHAGDWKKRIRKLREKKRKAEDRCA